MSVSAKPFQHSSAQLPPGYISITDREGREIIIPKFLIPATNHAFDTFHNYSAHNVKGENGGVSVDNSVGFRFGPEFYFRVRVISRPYPCLGRVRYLSRPFP
jgi:hypothetical protein